MESARRLLQANPLVVLGMTALAVVAGLAAGLEPGATVLTVIAVGAIAGVVSLAAVDHAPATATLEEPDLVRHLALELERSRRHEHPFSVARIPLVDQGAAGSAGRHLARSVQVALRTIDVAVAEGDSLYLVLPGSDPASVAACVRRLKDVRPGVFADADVRTASFPDDGVTLSGLLAVLDGEDPAAAGDDLPTLERRRRIVVDLTAVSNSTPVDVTQVTDGVDA